MNNESTLASGSSSSNNLALLFLRLACALPVLYHGNAILFGAFGGPGPQSLAAHLHFPHTVSSCGEAHSVLQFLFHVQESCLSLLLRHTPQ
jgi:hypothetical protein